LRPPIDPLRPLRYAFLLRSRTSSDFCPAFAGVRLTLSQVVLE
jgi:hypothetical protein